MPADQIININYWPKAMVELKFFEKVSGSIYAHATGKTIGNVGLIASDAGNYLIDTSMYPRVARELRSEIEQIKTGKVGGVFLTHYHFDHSGGGQVFHDVPYYAHTLADENFRTRYNEEEMQKNLQEREDKEMFDGLKMTPPNRIFDLSPFSPDDNNHIEVYRVGGHTSGSSIVYYKTEKVVFAGDNLFAGRYPWGGDPTAGPTDWLSSCNKIIELNPESVIPGHGDVQFNLDEVNQLKLYLEKVISTGKTLASESISDDSAISSLEEIDYLDEMREGMKKETLRRWYSVIKENPR